MFQPGRTPLAALSTTSLPFRAQQDQKTSRHVNSLLASSAKEIERFFPASAATKLWEEFRHRIPSSKT